MWDLSDIEIVLLGSPQAVEERDPFNFSVWSSAETPRAFLGAGKTSEDAWHVAAIGAAERARRWALKAEQEGLGVVINRFKIP